MQTTLDKKSWAILVFAIKCQLDDFDYNLGIKQKIQRKSMEKCWLYSRSPSHKYFPIDTYFIEKSL